ncbi:TetR family transcriptional regulator C-terminal domain-containing protein [Paenibacillus sp. JX-17]|uniref:TetR family transcriptional regulator C-terminal domain-containing protein n=1 Tax=Paenibacillus lacisoli TaxID=3064525 RepID=A0ABT9CJ11_9BACL|nr:TetR family transcriptional regulator C-terminal domain-containing protein [Paenibacillus sp. JX-17]MDO7908604.1 TetR family transcriptional regulator C-terminal domain-containing protein [Paenibacillus sp. JX-17]
MKKLIMETLPDTDEKRAESEVWMAFTAQALTDPSLKELAHKVYGHLRYMFEHVITQLSSLGYMSGDLDIEIEIQRLYALVDGLVLHAVLNPESYPASRLEAVIDYHLRSLCPNSPDSLAK